MSIQDEVNGHLTTGHLIRLRLFYPGLPEKRVLYLTPTLMALLQGPWAGNVKWEKRWSVAWQTLDDFINGLPRDRIFVRSAPRKKSSAFMSQLDPEKDEIWEMRCRDPKPGLRIFGSFIAQDIFVALTAAPHECLSSEEDWNRAIREYKEEWNRYFNSAAFAGSYPDDYLTKAIVLD
jgi:hypothetical protein